MPSARELLEQADALMRRNRSRDTMSPAMGPRTMAPMTTTRKAAPGDFPVLTESMQPPSPAPAFTPPAPPVARAPANEGPVEPTLRAPVDSAARVDARSTARATDEPQSRVQAEAVVRPSFEAARVVPPVADPRARGEPAPQPAQAWQSSEAAQAQPGQSSDPADTPSPRSSNAADAQPRRTSDVVDGQRPVAVDASRPDATVSPRLDAIDTPRPAAKAFADVPVLTDAIEEIDAALIAAAEEGVPSIWNDEAMQGDDSVLGPAPKSIAVIPDNREHDRVRAHDNQSAAGTGADVAAASTAAASSAVAASTAELIDEVRMQVLQRIDMFTDTGLREQLGERLKPIVDRASAELVATINQHVGELLRTYVAEAIERELDRLRNEVR